MPLERKLKSEYNVNIMWSSCSHAGWSCSPTSAQNRSSYVRLLRNLPRQVLNVSEAISCVLMIPVHAAEPCWELYASVAWYVCFVHSKLTKNPMQANSQIAFVLSASVVLPRECSRGKCPFCNWLPEMRKGVTSVLIWVWVGIIQIPREYLLLITDQSSIDRHCDSLKTLYF